MSPKALFRNTPTSHLLAAALSKARVIAFICGLMACLELLPSSAAQQVGQPGFSPIQPTFFGMHIHYAATGTRWPSVSFGSWRLWDANVAWAELEPQQGKWKFHLLDSYLALADNHGVELVLTLGMTPTWASARPNEPSAYGTKAVGWAAEPARIADWDDYVWEVATRYKGRIRYWEIWNEPNGGGFYSGTMEQMLEMAQHAYTILKNVDADNVVITPSAVGVPGIAWLARYLQAGGGQSADVIGFHFYVYPAPPEAMLPRIQKVQSLMMLNGVADKPLWNTESGWSRPSVFATDDEMMAFVSRALLLNAVGGVSRFYWYAWDNSSWVTLFMLDPWNSKPTAAAYAYAETEQWITGAQPKGCTVGSDGIWLCDFVGADKNPFWIAWNPAGAMQSSVHLRTGATQLRTLAGQSLELAGRSQIEIGIVPVLLR